LNIAQARAALVAAAGLALASVSAGAQQSPDPYTSNSFNDRTVWITIYDLGKTRQLDYGCVNAAGTRKWGSGGYAFGSFYYIRAEIMTEEGCKGAKVCDTTVQFNPQANLTGKNESGLMYDKPYNTYWTIKGDGQGKCYWDQASSRPQVTNGIALMKDPVPQPCTGEFKYSTFQQKVGITNHVAKVPGSWAQTCRGCTYRPPLQAGEREIACDPIDGCPKRDILAAECKNMAGVWPRTSLGGVAACKAGTIWNDNGVLKCTR